MLPEARACGGSSRMIASEVTDFPEPDSPTSASTSPRAMLNETSCAAGNGPCGLGNVTVRFSREINRVSFSH